MEINQGWCGGVGMVGGNGMGWWGMVLGVAGGWMVWEGVSVGDVGWCENGGVGMV